MKKAANIILGIVSAIVAIISLAFVVIEGRLLLSFDWSLHEHEFLGFIQYLARVGLAILCLSTSISSIVYMRRKSFNFEGFCLLAVAIAISTGATNGVGLYMIIAASLYLASAAFHHLASKHDNEE